MGFPLFVPPKGRPERLSLVSWRARWMIIFPGASSRRHPGRNHAAIPSRRTWLRPAKTAPPASPLCAGHSPSPARQPLFVPSCRPFPGQGCTGPGRAQLGGSGRGRAGLCVQGSTFRFDFQTRWESVLDFVQKHSRIETHVIRTNRIQNFSNGPK